MCQYMSNLTKNIHINIITLPTNKGIATALNIGVQNCKNDLIFRMDSDDVMAYDRLQI